MTISRRAFIVALPLASTLAPTAGVTAGLGGGSSAFAEIVRQIGGVADISPYMLSAAEYEFAQAFDPGARGALLQALGTGSIEDRMAVADDELKTQVQFIARFLYTGEVTRDGRTSADYYPWCLAWKSLTFATAPGLCGGAEFGHWANAPVPGAM